MPKVSGRLIAVLALALALQSAAPMSPEARATSLEPPAGTIPVTLFNLNVINLDYGVAWPTVPFACWRNFHSFWTWLEPRKREWQWAKLDREMGLARQKRTPVMLLLQHTPEWASSAAPGQGANFVPAADLGEWRDYVRAVVSRYRGQIEAIEFWNEPNVARSYQGTPEQLAVLSREAYRVIKEVDPPITVVSPALSPCCSATSFLERYFAAGGGQQADVIAYHFYAAPRPPEAMLPMINQLKAVMAAHGVAGKPIWNTETGWNFQNHDRNDNTESWAGEPLPDELAAAYVARAHILSWAAGVERLFWYAWGHRCMGLTDYDGCTPKLASRAYTQVQSWLVGARMERCSLNAQGTWECQLRRGAGTSFILWNPAGSRTVELAPWRRAREARILDGTKFSLTGRHSLEIGPSPVLLESSQ